MAQHRGIENGAASITRRGLVGGAACVLVAGAIGSLALADEAPADEAPAGERRVVTGAATGRMGQIVVKVALDGGAVESVDVVKHDETLTIAASALARIPQQVVKYQTLDVDAVAGATVTSYGVIFAIENALAAAGMSREDLPGAGTVPPAPAHEEPVEADVIVVGSGLAGLTCAARLLEQGKTVAVFEESGHLGGSVPLAAGWISGAGSMLEADCGVEDSADNYYAYMEQLAAHYGGVIDFPDIVRAYCENNGPALDWLDEHARIDLGDRQGTNGLYDTPDVPRVFKANGCGKSIVVPLLEALQPAVEEGRLSLVLHARVEAVLKDAQGAACGVRVAFADGAQAEYASQAVVVATGGYGHDCTGMKDAGNYVNVASCNPSTAHGHGRDLLAEAGAAFVLDDANASYGAAVQNLGDEARYQANIFAPGMVWVDAAGRRVADESNWLNSFYAWDEAPDNYVWVLFSDAQVGRSMRPLVRTSYHEGEVSPFESWELFDRFEGSETFRGATAAELAEAAGIDADGLAETFERYNGFAAAGADEDFGNPNVAPLEGTLYAIKTVPYMLMTAGGVKVTPSAQVLDANDEAIPGLYAAGEVLGIRQYAAYTRAGNGIGGALTWGYIAANSICG